MSTGDLSKEEERILRSMTRKNRMSVTIPSKGAVTSTGAQTTSNHERHVSQHADQIEQLQLKKRTVLGTMTSTKRELDDLRSEIAKLKSKEAELVSLLEKRESSVQQLTQQIEELENAQRGVEEGRRKVEEEKARYLREEIERRKKEEEEERKKREEEDRKRREEEAERRKKEEELERKRREEEEKKLTTIDEDALNRTSKQSVSAYIAPIKQPVSPSYNRAPSNEQLPNEGMNAEESRILRAMSRAKSGTALGSTVTTGRTSSYRPAEPKTVTSPKQPAPEPAWKEQERIREAERQTRVAEDNRRKEEERRAILDQQSKAKQTEQQRIMEIQQRGGKLCKFSSPVVYDIDVDVKICGDFTDWQEIPITSEIDGNFQYTISLPVSPGVHFYRFKIGNKWDVNKNLPTGVAPTGDVMNKVDVQ